MDFHLPPVEDYVVLIQIDDVFCLVVFDPRLLDLSLDQVQCFDHPEVLVDESLRLYVIKLR